MKRYLHALCMCFSMFSALPAPLHIWEEEARPLMLLFLPFVGGVIGGIWALGGWIMQELELPALLQGAILCSLPLYLRDASIWMDTWTSAMRWVPAGTWNSGGGY